MKYVSSANPITLENKVHYYCQAQVQSPKVQIPVKGFGVTLKSHQVLKGKKSKYDPLYPSRWSVGPGGQRDQEHGVVLHVQGEVYQQPITSRTGSSQVPKGLRMTPPTHPGCQVDSEVKDIG